MLLMIATALLPFHSLKLAGFVFVYVCAYMWVVILASTLRKCFLHWHRLRGFTRNQIGFCMAAASLSVGASPRLTRAISCRSTRFILASSGFIMPPSSYFFLFLGGEVPPPTFEALEDAAAALTWVGPICSLRNCWFWSILFLRACSAAYLCLFDWSACSTMRCI